jgi:hypothetical protein
MQCPFRYVIQRIDETGCGPESDCRWFALVIWAVLAWRCCRGCSAEQNTRRNYLWLPDFSVVPFSISHTLALSRRRVWAGTEWAEDAQNREGIRRVQETRAGWNDEAGGGKKCQTSKRKQSESSHPFPHVSLGLVPAVRGSPRSTAQSLRCKVEAVDAASLVTVWSFPSPPPTVGRGLLDSSCERLPRPPSSGSSRRLRRGLPNPLGGRAGVLWGRGGGSGSQDASQPSLVVVRMPACSLFRANTCPKAGK